MSGSENSNGYLNIKDVEAADIVISDISMFSPHCLISATTESLSSLQTLLSTVLIEMRFFFFSLIHHLLKTCEKLSKEELEPGKIGGTCKHLACEDDHAYLRVITGQIERTLQFPHCQWPKCVPSFWPVDGNLPKDHTPY